GLVRRVRRKPPAPSFSPVGGVGIGWREELAGFVGRRDGLGFVEVVAESIHDDQPPPPGLEEWGGGGGGGGPAGSGCRWARPVRPTRHGSGTWRGWPSGWGRRWSASTW